MKRFWLLALLFLLLVSTVSAAPFIIDNKSNYTTAFSWGKSNDYKSIGVNWTAPYTTNITAIEWETAETAATGATWAGIYNIGAGHPSGLLCNSTVVNGSTLTNFPTFSFIAYNFTGCTVNAGTNYGLVFASENETTYRYYAKSGSQPGTTVSRSNNGVSFVAYLNDNGLNYRLWADNITGPVQHFLTLQANDTVTNNLITGICVLASGANTLSSCNTTGTSVNFNVTGTYNLSVYSIGTGDNLTETYFSVNLTNYVFNDTKSILVNTSQGYLNLTAYRLYLNTSIGRFNATNNKQTVSMSTALTSILVNASVGTNNIQFFVGGNYSVNASCTLSTALSTGFCSGTDIYDNRFSIGAFFNDAVASAFIVSATNNSVFGTSTKQTTNGSVVFSLLQGYQYFFFMNISSNAMGNATLPANASTNAYNFSLSSYNNFTLYFYNETTDTPLTNATVTVQIITLDNATNYTTNNGTLRTTLGTPENYTIRYWIDPSVPRDYYVTLTSASASNVTLYVIDTSISSFYLPVVNDQHAQGLGDATVQLLRYFVSDNSYKVVEMATTDTNGRAVIRVVPNYINYKLIISLGGFSTSTSPTKFTETTNTYTLTTTTPILTSVYGIESVAESLTFNNATNTFIFTWVDTENIVEQGCMTVTAYNSSGTFIVSDQCSTGMTGSLIYTVTNTNQTRYVASAVLDTTTTFSTYPIGVLTANFDLTPEEVFGIVGFILLTFVVLTLGFIANEHGPTHLFAVLIFGIVLFGMIGIIAYAWEAVVGMVIFILIILVRIHK